MVQRTEQIEVPTSAWSRAQVALTQIPRYGVQLFDEPRSGVIRLGAVERLLELVQRTSLPPQLRVDAINSAANYGETRAL